MQKSTENEAENETESDDNPKENVEFQENVEGIGNFQNVLPYKYT